MKLTIDTEQQTLTVEDKEATEALALYSDKAFELLSDQWVKLGWNQKHLYTFTWLGRPVIQLPDDMLRMQEVIFNLQPDWIIETGVAHGGSLIFYASLCKAMGRGKVVGIDIEIREHNKQALDQHFLREYITLLEGSSTAPEIVHEVKSMVKPDDKVLVILDSDHSYQHVMDELDAYHSLVSVGSYIVATDGIMYQLTDVPRGKPQWEKDNPRQAAIEFAQQNEQFVIEQPKWNFSESSLSKNITHWPSAWLKRVK